jgi:hypothetical protein
MFFAYVAITGSTKIQKFIILVLLSCKFLLTFLTLLRRNKRRKIRKKKDKVNNRKEERKEGRG